MGITVWRVIAALPALAFSVWVWLVMWALAPGHISATATGVWAVMLAGAPTRTGQNALMWLLPARRPNVDEERAMAHPIARMRQTGPAAARLGVLIVGMPGIAAAGSGRHNIVVTRDAIRALQSGRLPPDHMTALLVSAAGQAVLGATRLEWPLTVLTLPWLPFRILLQGFMIAFGATLLVRFILKMRGLLAIAALVQTTLEGQPLNGVGVLAAVAASYWQPHAARRVVLGQTRAGNEYAGGEGVRLERRAADKVAIVSREARTTDRELDFQRRRGPGTRSPGRLGSWRSRRAKRGARVSELICSGALGTALLATKGDH